MSLPLLPGYSFRDLRKTDYKKSQRFGVSAGLMAEKKETPEALEEKAKKCSQSAVTAPPSQPTATFPDYIPAHVAYDHLVLRFYAYFRESVSESAQETFRVRYVSIHVYLEDETVMIEESRNRNSGLPQGVLLKRMKVLKPGSSDTYTIQDFRVGINIEIFGTVYRIFECDQFTQDYLKSVNLPVGEFEEPPDDLYSIKRKLTERPVRVTHINTDKANLRRFLDYDGKVLQFSALWDNRGNLFGERRKFALNYYLVDGTFEIRQMLAINSGRDPASVFLKKSILKHPTENRPYDDQDLKIGAVIDVFGRQFLLYDADSFTKRYLDDKYGKHDWTPVNIEENEETKASEPVIAPYNGWGDEEDSVGFCKTLHPKPPMKDVKKLIEKDGQILRFTARLQNPQPQDVAREFVIAYYLADDTVAVFEQQKRNSGFREGKFIQRSKIKNPAEGRYFKASDFAVGKEFSLNSFIFIITGADEYALNYMEANSNEFPNADLAEIVRQMRGDAQKVEALKGILSKADPNNTGFVEEEQAGEAISESFGLPKHQIITILRKWAESKGFDYFSLMSVLV